ncbi:hypothetical protein D9758_014918 [Tetrapyrgos nigripes]|uniref:DUF3295 domain-containing protein n=1 Tax=Tetrapyrgos nigripes TaxID=182062 RepID=A0A8H5C984_9AGAR|nr:hypothetical protein D9758_014918 [Tetrapyrgos nigripes]
MSWVSENDSSWRTTLAHLQSYNDAAPSFSPSSCPSSSPDPRRLPMTTPETNKDMFSKLPRENYSSKSIRPEPGLLTRLMKPDSHLFNTDDFYNNDGINEGGDVDIQGELGEDESSLSKNERKYRHGRVVKSEEKFLWKAPPMTMAACKSGKGTITSAVTSRITVDSMSSDGSPDLDQGETYNKHQQVQLLEATAILSHLSPDVLSAPAIRDRPSPCSSTLPMQRSRPQAVPARQLPYPYNLPPPLPPTSPRTTRQMMLRNEISESCRQNLLWHRRVTNEERRNWQELPEYSAKSHGSATRLLPNSTHMAQTETASVGPAHVGREQALDNVPKGKETGGLFVPTSLSCSPPFAPAPNYIGDDFPNPGDAHRGQLIRPMKPLEETGDATNDNYPAFVLPPSYSCTASVPCRNLETGVPLTVPKPTDERLPLQSQDVYLDDEVAKCAELVSKDGVCQTVGDVLVTIRNRFTIKEMLTSRNFLAKMTCSPHTAPPSQELLRKMWSTACRLDIAVRVTTTPNSEFSLQRPVSEFTSGLGSNCSQDQQIPETQFPEVDLDLDDPNEIPVPTKALSIDLERTNLPKRIFRPTWLSSLHRDWGGGLRERRRTGRVLQKNRDRDIMAMANFIRWYWYWTLSSSSSSAEAFRGASGFGISGSSFVICENSYTNNYYNYPGPGPGQTNNSGTSPDELLRQIQLERRMLEIERLVFNIERILQRMETRMAPEPDPPDICPSCDVLPCQCRPGHHHRNSTYGYRYHPYASMHHNRPTSPRSRPYYSQSTYTQNPPS